MDCIGQASEADLDQRLVRQHPQRRITLLFDLLLLSFFNCRAHRGLWKHDYRSCGDRTGRYAQVCPFRANR